MTASISVSSFTSKSQKGIQRRLITEVTVNNENNVIKVPALWDTGATNTCVSNDVVNKLSLICTGKKNMQTPSGVNEANTYLVTIALPNNVVIKDIEVCNAKIEDQGIGVLIGMDIMTKGDFALSNYNGRTVFSFRMPSIKMTDYVEQQRVQGLIGTHGLGNRRKKR